MREPAGGRRGRSGSLAAALAGLGFVILLLILVELAVPSAGGRRVPAQSVLDMLAVVGFAGTGLLAWYRRPHNAMGRLMVLTAVAVWLSSLVDNDVPPMQLVGALFEELWLAVLVHVLLAFPSGRVPSRAATAVVVGAYVQSVVFPVLSAIIRGGVGHAVIRWLQLSVGVATSVVVVVILIVRLTRVDRARRRQLLPFVGYGCVAMVIITATVVAQASSDSLPLQQAAVTTRTIALIGLAGAFLAGILGGAFGRAGEVEEVARGMSSAAGDSVELDGVVARALGDPSARVLYLTGTGRYLTRDGRFVDLVDPGRGRWPVRAGDESLLGAIDFDEFLVADRNLLGAVEPAVSVALQHQQLVVELQVATAELRNSADELQVSRRRIVSAAEAERRRISRDLHDGAQQRIVLLGIEAQRISRRADDPEFVRELSASLTGALLTLSNDLRRLAHGLVPEVLEQRGLAAAVEQLGADLPVPVDVDVRDLPSGLPAEVESTAFFVVNEALTNVLKHAQAQHVRVAAEYAVDRVRIAVTDDGVGVGSSEGFGLRAMRERVAGLDGTVTVVSAPGRGTTVRAEFSAR